MPIELLSETPSDSFEELVHRIESSEAYDIEDARYEISEWLYSAMEVRGKKKSELAEMLNTSRAYVTKLLQGNGNFTVETLVKLARALGYKFKPTFMPKEAIQTLAVPALGLSGGSYEVPQLLIGGQVVPISSWKERRRAEQLAEAS